MINKTTTYSNPKQATLPLFLSDFLNICDLVLTFDRLMGGIDLVKYLNCIPVYQTGRIRYNLVNILSTLWIYDAGVYVTKRTGRQLQGQYSIYVFNE